MTTMSSTNSKQKRGKKSFHRMMRSVLLVFALLMAGVGWMVFFARQRTAGYDSMKKALASRRLSEAEFLARSWLSSHHQDVDALLVLGEVLQRQGKFDEAIEAYRTVPDDAGEKATAAAVATASILLNDGRLADVERTLLNLKSPQYRALTIDGLWATLLSLSGQRWESTPYLQRTLGVEGDLFRKLILFANPDDMPIPPDALFAKMHKVRDPLCSLGCARVAASLGRAEKATKLVRECLEKRPHLIEAHVLMGDLLLNAGDLENFDLWEKNLPATSSEHPSIWYLKGRRLQEAGHRKEAIRCFWEALRRQPNHDRSTYRLGQLLSAEGRDVESQAFFDRAKLLTRLAELATKLFDNRQSENGTSECASLTYKLGRLHESKAWCQYTLSIAPGNEIAIQILDDLRSELKSDTPWILPGNDLASRFDLSSFPLPETISNGGSLPNSIRRSVAAPKQISFVDDARRLGIDFEYYNGDDPTSDGKRMFEYTGGGVAAFDFDRDDWCDIYFSQGTSWPINPANLAYTDVIYRNIAGQQMCNVTSFTGVQDAGFGQGISSSDFDNDGFPDIYVANLDGNRLYKNQGDGTFSDVTASCGLGEHSHWTTSCLIADLNNDSLPDVYDVTFLEASDIFSRICVGDDGRHRSCAPSGFDAAPDHAYINLGDGTFREVTQDWGFDAPNGDGLGIVAGDFDDSGSISIFIANDGRANFFFSPEIGSDGRYRWNEIGVASGLAFDEVGSAQACMGVGAGDANNDNRLDLFVTNFYNESNTLYVNLGGNSFVDGTRSAGLRDPSIAMLGFGTQFLDADLDGWEDLILVNGHVDDFTHKQIPYKMRPQFFKNIGARFEERFGNELGPFFDEPRLGRGLARLDWNRDGSNDVVISYLGNTASILTNRTERTHYGIGIRLVGTKLSRDSIGTRVIVDSSGTRRTRQLTGGDGYLATNERRLEFGLAEDQKDVDIEIHWMGGDVETFHQVTTNREYLAIEGRGELLPVRVD